MKANKLPLSNGLRVVSAPMQSLPSVTLTVWTKTGSRKEDDRLAGISHFLEHMVFKGGKKYKTAQELSAYVDSFGAEQNAATSKEWTNFYIRAAAEHLPKAFDVLSDMVLAPEIRQEDIDREKGVIIEEINMYEDTPRLQIWEVFEDLIFKGNTLARDTIGTKETVMSFTHKDFVDYRKLHYFSDNMLITAAGGFDENELMKLAEKHFGRLDKSGSSNGPAYKHKSGREQVLVKNKKTEQAHIVMGYLGYEMGRKDQYIEEVLGTILGGGMSSRLFSEIREKRGLAYSVHTSPDHYTDIGQFTTYAGVDPKNAVEVVKIVKNEHENLVTKNDITSTELAKAKAYMKGHFALSLENTRAVGGFFGFDELLLGKMRSTEEIFEGIDAVAIDEVVALAKKLFVPENLYVSVIGPYKSDTTFKKALV